MTTGILDRARSRRAYTALGFACALFVGACGDDEPSGPASDDIVGTWELIDGADTTYVVVTSSSVETFTNLGSCFLQDEFEIVDSDDDVYELEHASGETIEVELRRSGDELLIDGSAFEESDFDTDDLDICQPISLPACSTLPELAAGGTIEGELDGSDPVDLFGSFYELYRVEIESTATIRIDMESIDLDSFLILYDADEVEIAFNDDRDDTTLDANLQELLQPGCYIVMATSFGAEETGVYTISLSEL